MEYKAMGDSVPLQRNATERDNASPTVAESPGLTSCVAIDKRVRLGEGNSDDQGHRPRKYQDHSRDPILGPPDFTGPTTEQHQYHECNALHGGGNDIALGQTVFPLLLYRMVSEAHSMGFSSIVSWRPHGRAFQIFDRQRFEQQVLPKYFRTTRYASLVRQLHFYQFYRINRGADTGAFFHEYFLRGRPDLLSVGVHRRAPKPKKRRRSDCRLDNDDVGTKSKAKRQTISRTWSVDLYLQPVCNENEHSRLRLQRATFITSNLAATTSLPSLKLEDSTIEREPNAAVADTKRASPSRPSSIAGVAYARQPGSHSHHHQKETRANLGFLNALGTSNNIPCARNSNTAALLPRPFSSQPVSSEPNQALANPLVFQTRENQQQAACDTGIARQSGFTTTPRNGQTISLSPFSLGCDALSAPGSVVAADTNALNQSSILQRLQDIGANGGQISFATTSTSYDAATGAVAANPFQPPVAAIGDQTGSLPLPSQYLALGAPWHQQQASTPRLQHTNDQQIPIDIRSFPFPGPVRSVVGLRKVAFAGQYQYSVTYENATALSPRGEVDIDQIF